MRLLIVDDHGPTGQSLQALLEERCEVRLAQSFEEGYEALRDDGPFDAVMVDVHLGDGNGIELIARASGEKTQWLVMTRDSDRYLVMRAAELGAAFIAKPFTGRQLEHWLDSVNLGEGLSARERVAGSEEQDDDQMEAALDAFVVRHNLSSGERRVLAQAMRGRSREGIALALDVSIHTYQKRAAAIRRKTGSSVQQAAVRILRWAVIGPET